MVTKKHKSVTTPRPLSIISRESATRQKRLKTGKTIRKIRIYHLGERLYCTTLIPSLTKGYIRYRTELLYKGEGLLVCLRKVHGGRRFLFFLSLCRSNSYVAVRVDGPQERELL